MNALMMAAPWSQFLRRRTIDDIPDYIFGSAFLSVVVIGSIATMERRMNSRRRAFLEVEREEETLSPPFSVPAGASTHTHEETAISNETDEASHTFPVNIATTDSTGNNDTSRLNQWDLEHDRLLEISGAVEITIMNFPLRRGGETLSWFAMCDTITTVNADAVALGSECEGRLTQIADSCGYPFVDRKRNLMAKYPIFDSMGTIGTVHGLPTLDGNYAHVWIMVAPGRGIAMAILALSFDSNLGGSTSIGARHDLTSLASSGVPVFLCGQNSANCTPDRAGSALFLTSSDGKSLTSSLNGNGVIEGLPTCGHAHGSAVFRDSFTEAETRSSLGAPTFDPSSTLTGSPCILTAGPTQMLSCEYVEFDTIASRRSKSSSRNRSIGGKLATNVAREQGVPAGCGAVVSSFRVVPAVAPPMVAVEHSVVTEGQDFVVRPHDPSSSRSSSSSSGGEGNSNGWWIEVRVASRVSSGDNAIARSRASNNSSSSLNADSNSSNLWTAGHFSGSTGVRADLGGVGNGDASGSGAPGAYVGALLSWREAPGGRLCARFAGGQLGAGEYEAVLLDALTGADLATSRFQVRSKHDLPTLVLPTGARVRRGARFRVAARNAPGWQHDWCGLFGRGVPCGSACEPLSGRVSLRGQCFVDLDVPTNAADRSGPLPAGEYEVRLMRDNSPTVVAQVAVTLVEDFTHDFSTNSGGYFSSSSSVGSARSLGTRGSAHNSGGGSSSSSVCSSSVGGSPRRPLANASQRRAALNALGSFRPSSESVPEHDRHRVGHDVGSSGVGNSSSRVHLRVGVYGGDDKFHTPSASAAGTLAGEGPLRLSSTNLRGESRGL